MSNKIYRICVIVLMMIIFLGVVTVGAQEKELKIMLVAKNLADPYSSWLMTMAEKTMEEDYPEIKYKLLDQQSDPANTQQIIDQAIVEEYDSMVLQKVSGSQNTDSIFQDAADRGLYIAIINNTVDDGVTSSAFAPEYEMGFMVGEVAAKNLPENAKVVVLMSTPSLFSSEERRRGYQDALFNERPDVTILDEANIEGWKKDLAISKMEDWCQRFPEIDGVISMNDGMALGAIEAAKANQRDLSKMQFYGIDGLADGCLSIEADELTATVLQDAAAMAKAGVELAVKIAKGELTEPEKVEIVPVLITKDNVEEFIEMHRKNGLIK